MHKQAMQNHLLERCKKHLHALLFCSRDKIIHDLSGGKSLQYVLATLNSLVGELQNPPHYPMRVVVQLAAMLKISVPQAKKLWNFLERENLIRYSCTFETEQQGNTALEINPLDGLSAAAV